MVVREGGEVAAGDGSQEEASKGASRAHVGRVRARAAALVSSSLTPLIERPVQEGRDWQSAARISQRRWDIPEGRDRVQQRKRGETRHGERNRSLHAVRRRKWRVRGVKRGWSDRDSA